MPALTHSPIHRLAETGLALAKAVGLGALLPIAVVGALALIL